MTLDRSLAENKTKPTAASVAGYIDARGNEEQRADCKQLIALLKKATKQSPKMWGPSIYESGRTGEAPLAGFAIRGRELVVYIAEEEGRQALLDKLGPHRIGKSCLYIKRLADIDRSVLETIVTGSVAQMKRRYG